MSLLKRREHRKKEAGEEAATEEGSLEFNIKAFIRTSISKKTRGVSITIKFKIITEIIIVVVVTMTSNRVEAVVDTVIKIIREGVIESKYQM